MNTTFSRAAVAVIMLVLSIVGCDVETGPDAPFLPVGPYSGSPGSTYVFKAYALDPEEAQLSLRLSWGDGDTTPWGDFAPPGDTFTSSHAWDTLGYYRIRAQARNLDELLSDWSEYFQITIAIPNQPPEQPVIDSGPAGGYVGVEYLFWSSGTDPEQDSISFRFDWGDGDTSVWTAFLGSGSATRKAHVWDTAGTFPVRVQARDRRENRTEWSEPHMLDITMPRYPWRVLTSIPVNGRPTGVVFDPTSEFAYVAGCGDSVCFIRTFGNLLDGAVYVGTSQEGIAVSPDGQRLYVGYWGGIAVLDPVGRYVILNIDMPWTVTSDIVFTPSGDYAYAGIWETGDNEPSVYVINASSHTVVDSIMVPGYTYRLAMHPGGERVYLANHASMSVFVASTATNDITDSIPIGHTPNDVAVSPDGDYAWVSTRDTLVFVIRTSDNAVVDSIRLGSIPGAISFLPDGDHAFVVDSWFEMNGENAYVVRTEDFAVVDSFKIDEGIWGLDVSPDGNLVYITANSGNVTVLGY